MKRRFITLVISAMLIAGLAGPASAAKPTNPPMADGAVNGYSVDIGCSEDYEGPFYGAGVIEWDTSASWGEWRVFNWVPSSDRVTIVINGEVVADNIVSYEPGFSGNRNPLTLSGKFANPKRNNKVTVNGVTWTTKRC